MSQVLPPRSVLVLRLSSAGDVVLTAPALAALRRAWPDSRIVFATYAHYLPLLRGNPHVDAILPIARQGALQDLLQQARREAPAALLDLHGKLRGWALQLLLWRRPVQRWRKRPWTQSLAVRYGGARYHAEGTLCQRYADAVARLVGRPLEPEPLRYYVTPADRQAAAALLQARGLDLSRCLVGMAPGAMWASKRWPAPRFAALARWLHGQGHQVVVSGSPAEASLVDEVVAGAPGAVGIVAEADLGTLGGIVAHCAAFVANDSGPMHMARGLGVPTLVLFGSTDPGQFDFSGHEMLRVGTHCSPCCFHGRAECPRGHMRCLQDLRVDLALAALQRLLQRGPVPWVMG